jgi:hypothetical protein
MPAFVTPVHWCAAMKIGNFLNQRFVPRLLIAIGFPLELLFIMMGNMAGIIITPIVLAGLGFLLIRPSNAARWAYPDKTLGQRISEESPSSFTHPVGRWDQSLN